MTEKITKITLRDTLPAVFERESIPSSDIWKANVALERGRCYLIEAASGTGKSSLCSFIYGLRSDYLGTILLTSGDRTLDAKSLTVNDWQEIRRRHIAYLPQELALFPELTAIENIRLKNDLTNALTDKEITAMLEELGIAHRTHQPVGRMSIGQQQRVAIIRALAQPFDFLLLDEPVSHLDETNNRIAASMVEHVAARYGSAIVATSVGNPLLLEGSCEVVKL